MCLQRGYRPSGSLRWMPGHFGPGAENPNLAKTCWITSTLFVIIRIGMPVRISPGLMPAAKTMHSEETHCEGEGSPQKRIVEAGITGLAACGAGPTTVLVFCSRTGKLSKSRESKVCFIHWDEPSLPQMLH